jgi:hypothetical protein
MSGMVTQEEIDAENVTFADIAGGKVEDTPAPPVDAPADDGPVADDIDPAIERARTPDGKFAKEDVPRQPGTVPQGALHAEREGHKKTKAELQAAQDTLRQFAEQRARIQAAKPQPAPEPDQQDNGLDHLRSRLAQLETVQHSDQKRREMASVDDNERQTVAAHMGQAEANFRAATPDYDAAVQHLLQARARQVARFDPDPARVQTAVLTEIYDMSRTAMERGMDPAQLAYEMAKDWGYQGKPKPDMIDAIAAGTKSRSLGGAGGGSPQGNANVNAMANMSEDEFLDAYNSDPAFRALADRLG